MSAFAALASRRIKRWFGDGRERNDSKIEGGYCGQDKRASIGEFEIRF